MKKTRVAIVAILICLAMIMVSPLTIAGKNKVVLEERSTWDLDMIDVDDVPQTGNGVYVAVLDTGLVPNWKDYFPEKNIMTGLGKGFYEDVKWDQASGNFIESGIMRETTFIGSTGSSHGTHVTSTILGYNYYSPADAAGGYPLNPVHIRGVAPDVKIIPVKVLADYHIGKSQINDDYDAQHLVFGTEGMVIAGIEYATELCKAGYSPMIITMSLGSSAPSDAEHDAIIAAIDAGVKVVASAGNEGLSGMGYPGGYEEVISVGASGWKYEWQKPDSNSFYRLWWLQDNKYGYRDISEPTSAGDVYVTDFSSRELEGQDLDVLAPGSWVRGPYPGDPGYCHMPWWAEGNPQGKVASGNNFYYLGGTSMAAPHVTGLVALMLEKNPDLTQEEVEAILETTALHIDPGSMEVFDRSINEWTVFEWGSDATGAGLIQAKGALGAV